MRLCILYNFKYYTYIYTYCQISNYDIKMFSRISTCLRASVMDDVFICGLDFNFFLNVLIVGLYTSLQ